MSSEAAVPVTRFRPPSPAWLWLMRGLALAAVAVTALLVAESWRLGGTLPGCGIGSGCEQVLGSRWSQWFGIPVAVPALGVYLAMLLLLAQAGPAREPAQHKSVWTLLVLLAVAALGAIAWFIVLQFAVIGSVCAWCMVAHGLGGVLSVMVLFAAPLGSDRVLPEEPADAVMLPPRRSIPLVAAGLVLVAALIAGQLSHRPPTHRIVAIGHLEINVSRMPIVGSPDAAHVLVHVFDFTCPRCRELHFMLKASLERYGDQLAIAAAPAPLNAACNPHAPYTPPRHEHACELATIALAVWSVEPAMFADIEDWLFETVDPREPADALAYARTLVDPGKLEEAMSDPKLAEYLRLQSELNHQLGQVPVDGYAYGLTLPKLVVRWDTMVPGVPATAAELYDALEDLLGIVPRQ